MRSHEDRDESWTCCGCFFWLFVIGLIILII